MTFRDAQRKAARDYLYAVLRETDGDVAAAAKLAGMHRTTIYKLFPKYGLKLIAGGVLVDLDRGNAPNTPHKTVSL